MAASPFSHRILTADINRDTVLSILSKYFDGFTVYPTLGYWKGIPEHSLVVEMIGSSYTDVLDAAQEIKAANNQDAVIVFSVQGKSVTV